MLLLLLLEVSYLVVLKVITLNPLGFVRDAVEGGDGFATNDIVIVPHEVLTAEPAGQIDSGYCICGDGLKI